MRRKIFIILSILLVSNFMSYCSETQPNVYKKAKELLVQANKNVDYSTFKKFYNLYSSLDTDEQSKIQIDSAIYNLVLRFLQKLSFQKPTHSLFLTYNDIFNYFNDNAEGGEEAAEDFSDYFMKNIKESLNTLDKIKDSKIQEKLISQATFVEGRDKKIIEYIETNKLKNKSYYKYFLKYKD